MRRRFEPGRVGPQDDVGQPGQVSYLFFALRRVPAPALDKEKVPVREQPCHLQGDRQAFPGDRADKGDVPGVNVIAGGILWPNQGMDHGREET